MIGEPSDDDELMEGCGECNGEPIRLVILDVRLIGTRFCNNLIMASFSAS